MSTNHLASGDLRRLDEPGGADRAPVGSPYHCMATETASAKHGRRAGKFPVCPDARCRAARRGDRDSITCQTA